MNGSDLIILGVVLVLFLLAVWFIRRNGTCTHNCAECHGICSAKKKNGNQKTLLERYYEDHPKKDSSNSEK